MTLFVPIEVSQNVIFVKASAIHIRRNLNFLVIRGPLEFSKTIFSYLQCNQSVS
jgi:hypothetical protein